MKGLGTRQSHLVWVHADERSGDETVTMTSRSRFAESMIQGEGHGSVVDLHEAVAFPH